MNRVARMGVVAPQFPRLERHAIDVLRASAAAVRIAVGKNVNSPSRAG
jgi:hypothetical protein